MVERHGWIVQGVSSTDTCPGPGFGYTVGLTAHGFPELAIAGLPQRVILNDLAGRVFDFNRRYSHGEVLDDVIGDGVKVTVVDGHYSREGLWPGTARALYGDTVRLQQICWPDDRNRFPWEAGYSLPPDGQPVIGRL